MSSRPEHRPIRVCTIPGRHSYVDRCLAGAPDVVHLPDPAGSTSYDDPWRPSPALEPAWVRAYAGQVDLMHLHFGYEHRTPQQLRTWTETLISEDIPFVLTVHDLDNPHTPGQERHHASLGVLTKSAAATITLTRGAAEELKRRYGVTAHVIPHPHQFDLGLVGRRVRARARRGGRIGLNLRSQRPNVDALAALSLLRQAPADTSIVIRVSTAILTGGDEVGNVIADGAREGRWEVSAVPGYTDERQLWEFLSGIDALILPYLWGTHSGWVESCWDVGTSVVAPAIGYYGEQHPVVTLALNARPDVVQQVLGELRPTDGATVQERRAEQTEVAARHAAIYRQVLG
ncbi:glycosyltransferase [Allobranchiibius sp. GilTou73]|uniref:glycosyltransferase n=1 Tax=Allobranchiibius sp. GilTou73 TaxID=2904523 RepID=UPI001F21E4AB|nr:glycosyltransferase [Allobranchiibius sp. GilTou73]UIJ35464.1 glycosyltransferase family 4 protein [Allobranchiibius sp. GilTou73]